MAKTTKTATKAADVKKEEVKVAAAPVAKAEVKKEEVKVEAPAKKEAAKKTTSTKKATTKKETAKKETTKKTTTAKKAETKVVLQFQHLDVDMTTIVENAKADYIANSGKKTAKDVAVYVKPEEFTAYYVIDGVSGKVNL